MEESSDLRQIKRTFPRRLIGMLIAVTLMGFSLSLLMVADLGIDAYSNMIRGFSYLIGWSYGTCNLVFLALLLVIVFFWDKRMIGLGTIGNMVVCGYACDFFSWVWMQVPLLANPMSLPGRLLLMTGALAVMVIAVTAYMSAGMGMSAFDALPFLIARRFPRLQFRFVRMGWDLTALVIGWVLGSAPGVLTVLLALLLGPVAGKLGGWFRTHVYGLPESMG